MKGEQVRKEGMDERFAEGMMLCATSKDSIRKLLGMVKKTAEHKINIRE